MAKLKNYRSRRVVSLFMSLLMLLTLMPTQAAVGLDSSDSATVSTDETMTASAEAVKTYNFLDANENVVNTQSVHDGGLLVEPDAPIVPDQDFIGWFLTGSSIPLDFSQPIAVASNEVVTVHAHYTARVTASTTPTPTPGAPEQSGETVPTTTLELSATEIPAATTMTTELPEASEPATPTIDDPVETESEPVSSDETTAEPAPSEDVLQTEESTAARRSAPVSGIRSITPVEDTHTYVFCDINGNEDMSIPWQIVKDGEWVLEPAIPEIPNKKFLYWSTEINGLATTAFDFNQPVSVTSTQEINLYPVYQDKVYVYFLHDDTDDNVQNYKIVLTKETVDGKTNDALIPVVTWPGKTFSHWSLAPNGAVFDFNTTITAHTNLYAVLQNQYTVSFDSQGGSHIESQNVDYNEPVGAPATSPIRDGYNFNHWSRTIGGTAYNFSEPVSSDMMLYAVWTPKAIAGNGTTIVNVYYTRNTFTLRFRSNNWGTLYNPPGAVQVKHGANIDQYWEQASQTAGTRIWRIWVGGTQGSFWTTPSEMPTAYVDYQKTTLTDQGYAYFLEYVTPNNTAPTNNSNYATIIGSTSGIQNLSYVRGPTYQGFTQRYKYGKYGNNALWIDQSSTAAVDKVYGVPFTGQPAQYYNLSMYTRNRYEVQYQTNGGTSVPSVQRYFQYPLDGLTATNPSFPYSFYDVSGTIIPAQYVIGETTKIESGITYYFQGWYDNQALAGTAFDPAGKIMPANNLVLYAKWAQRPLMVRFHANPQPDSPWVPSDSYPDGIDRGTQVPYQDPKELQIPPGADFTPPGNNDGAGDFQGWYWYVNGALTKYNFATAVDADLDLYAVWANPQFHVTYDTESNGGAGSVVDVNAYQYYTTAWLKTGAGVIPPDNKVFLGWSLAEDGSTGILSHSDPLVMDSNKILYAQYGPLNTPTTLTYKANGGTGEDYIVSDIQNNSTVTVLGNDTTNFSREGYQFLGWNTNAQGTGTSLKPGDLIQVDRLNAGTDNILYAQWEKLITVTAIKSWFLPAAGLPGGVAPPTVWFTLYRTNADNTQTTIGTKEVPEGVPTSTVSWDNQPETDTNGYTYVYDVIETDADGNSFTPINFIKDESVLLTVSNQYQSLSFTARKEWSANSPAEKPEVKFQLTRSYSSNGNTVTENFLDPVTVPSDTNTVTWNDLPQWQAIGVAYTYDAVEVVVPESYTMTASMDGDVRVITNTYQDTSYTVNKVWSDPDNRFAEESWPSLQLVLVRNGVDYKPPGQSLDYVYVPAQAKTDTSYSYTWTGLPKYDEHGEEYTYLAYEVSVPPHFQMSFEAQSNTITNTYTAGSLTADKIWQDDANAQNKRPASLQLQLYWELVSDSTIRGTYASAVTIDSDSFWRYMFVPPLSAPQLTSLPVRE